MFYFLLQYVFPFGLVALWPIGFLLRKPLSISTSQLDSYGKRFASTDTKAGTGILETTPTPVECNSWIPPGNAGVESA